MPAHCALSSTLSPYRLPGLYILIRYHYFETEEVTTSSCRREVAMSHLPVHHFIQGALLPSIFEERSMARQHIRDFASPNLTLATHLETVWPMVHDELITSCLHDLGRSRLKSSTFPTPLPPFFCIPLASDQSPMSPLAFHFFCSTFIVLCVCTGTPASLSHTYRLNTAHDSHAVSRSSAAPRSLSARFF